LSLTVRSLFVFALPRFFILNEILGACPELKFPTVVSRLVQCKVRNAQLFFRTSAVSRATGRFLNENRILPPLAYSTCVHALQALRAETSAVELHFADEEGDPYAVELAGRLGGYVIGKDSDFVIFNSDGYKGYIPIDEMEWQAPLPDDQVSVDGEDDAEFQTVKKPRAKRKITSAPQGSLGIVPPQGSNLSLSFTSYSPQVLADHFDIPVTLLPLLGALIGNDFSKDTEASSRRIQSLFFDRTWTLSQRIEKVAKTIQSVISPHRRKAKLQVGSVMDLIERTVNALLSRLPRTSVLGSGEVQSVIDKIVNATLQYAIPKYGGDVTGREGLWTNTVCALHDPETCTLLPIISRNVMRQAEESLADPNMLSARERYLDAYRSGLLSRESMDPLSSGSSWSPLFLENPDVESVGRSIGRPIRTWILAILDDTVGLGVQDDQNGSEKDDGDNDDDELIDVVESDSDDSQVDYLAPLKGELHRLRGSDDESTNPPLSTTPHRRLPTGRPYITEYFRSGTRIASEKVLVMPISELLSSISLPEYGEDDAPPLILRSEDDRLTILLRSLKSDYPTIRSLSPACILPVLAVRWVIHCLHSRFLENGSREREMERWTRRETRCFLASFPSEPHSSSDANSNNGITVFPPIDNRNVQLMAQVLMALDSIEQLLQALLLTSRIRVDFHRLSGKIFHGYLTGSIPLERELPHDIWEAAEENLADAFKEEVQKPTKKKTKGNTPSPAAQGKSSGGNKGLFSLLADLDE